MSGYCPRFVMRTFPRLSEGKRKAVLHFLLDALIAVDTAYLLQFPGCPLLYESGCRYLEEPAGEDDWQDVEETLHRGSGDCEDLACWRVAELRVRQNERAAAPHVSVEDVRAVSCPACRETFFRALEQDAAAMAPGLYRRLARQARAAHQRAAGCRDAGAEGDDDGEITTTYHIAVRRASGDIEDPSRLLGMR